MSSSNTLRLMIACTVGLFIACPAMALRCDHKIISEGMTQIEVRKYCGAPTSTQERTIVLAGAPHTSTRSRTDQSSRRELLFAYRGYEEVLIEEWTYNFGPLRFMCLIRFANGRVSLIEDLGYGYHE